MQIMQRIAKLALPIALLIPCIANADVARPSFDIALFGDDAGAVLSGNAADGFVFDIDATAFQIVTSDIENPVGLDNQSFTLHGTMAANPSPGATFSGTFEVGGGLLMGTFDDLSLKIFSGMMDFSANLTYTGGSLMGEDFLEPRLEGAQSANGSSLVAKLGEVGIPPVIPVPAAVWLFGTGLLGFAGLIRRKTA